MARVRAFEAAERALHQAAAAYAAVHIDHLGPLVVEERAQDELLAAARAWYAAACAHADMDPLEARL